MADTDSGEKKAGSGKLIIIILVLLVVLGGGAGAAWMFLGDSGIPGVGLAPGARPKSAVEIPLPNFLVNLKDRLGKRYVKATIVLTATNNQAANIVNARLNSIRDIITLILSSKTFEELSTTEGKILLKNEIVEQINLQIGQGIIFEVIIPDIILQ